MFSQTSCVYIRIFGIIHKALLKHFWTSSCFSEILRKVKFHQKYLGNVFLDDNKLILTEVGRKEYCDLRVTVSQDAQE